MAKHPNKKIIVIMGTLASGKGTQAEKLADVLGFYHFDTGPILKELLDSGDPSVAKEKAEYDQGKWVSPEFVAEKVLEKIPVIIADYKGVILSGSPRTLVEAEREFPVFEELVGKENVRVFSLNISEAESLKRSMGRLICEKNKHSIPNLPEFQDLRQKGVCPEDGSRLIKKSLDKPEILKSRLIEHNTRTLPVIGYLKQQGLMISEINGEQPIEKVFEDIIKHLS